MIKILYFIIFISIVVSCNLGKTSYSERLSELDAMLEEHPKAVLDSLKKIDVHKLNKSDRSYFYLLETSASDKNFIFPAKDSILRIAASHFESGKDFYNLARTQYYLAKYLQRQEEKEAAYDLLKQADLNLAKGDKEDPHFNGLVYYFMSRIQDEQGNMPESKIYAEKASEKFIESKDTISGVYSLKQLGQIYTNQKKYDSAFQYVHKAEELILKIKNQHSPKVSEAKSNIYINISHLYRNTLDLPNALKYARLSIETGVQNTRILAIQYNNLTNIFKALSQADSTKYYCEKMIAAAEREKMAFNLMTGYKILCELEEEQGNYKKACTLREKFNDCKDQYNLKNKSDSFIELEKKYNIAEKERQIYKAKNVKLQLFIIIVIIICFGTAVGVRFFYRHKRLQAKFEELSEEVKHTEWGFSVTKELITENHNYYDEMERLLNRYRMSSINSEMYNKFQDVFKAQKASYSARLFSTLTNFDSAFIKKFQKQFPKLSADDIMIAAMIRHQWNYSDISAVFHVSSEAIRKRKSRLTNKISVLLSKEIVLEDFLSKM